MTWYVIALIAAFLLVGLIFWQLRELVDGYRLATGTPWQRFLAVFSHSGTILLARITSFGAGTVAFVVNFLPSLDPATSLGSAVSGVLKPEWVPFYALGFGLLFEIVRRRSGSIDPILPPPQSVTTK